MAGYSGTPLVKKLGIKEGSSVTIVNGPRSFREELGPLPAGAKVVSRPGTQVDLVLFFVKTRSELARRFPELAGRLVSNGMLWIAWPKKSSGVPTDLSFAAVQETGLFAGLVDTKICAVNEIWSGLKFVVRLKDRPGRGRSRK